MHSAAASEAGRVNVFEFLVEYNQARTGRARSAAYERMVRAKPQRAVRELDAQQAAYHSHWYIPAIRALGPRADFEADPHWIVRRIEPTISLAQAEKAIHVLTSLELLSAYDLSFTVELKDGFADGPVRVSQQRCQVDALETKHATLALASQPSGAVCNYANSSALSWRGGDDGSLRMPCRAATDRAAAVTCQQGLQCVDLGTHPAGDFSGGGRCLSGCGTDADCDALSTCQAGVCKLRSTGLSSERTR